MDTTPLAELTLRPVAYGHPDATALVARVQQEYVDRYGGPDDTPVDPGEFAPPQGRFVIGYVDLEPVAMGGFRGLENGTVEIKRMFVVPSHRGRGLSRLVLTRLEELAAEAGAQRVVLETGMKQPEAMALYASSGYDRIEAFDPPAGLFLVGYLDGVPVATGAWRRSPVLALGGTAPAEIKRMYVVPELRGRGLSTVVLAELERTATAAGHDVLVLETGLKQPEAIGLYTAHGYVPIEGFGHYCGNELSRCFGKRV